MRRNLIDALLVMMVVVAALTFACPMHAITAGSAPAPDDRRFDGVGAFAVSWRLGFDHGSHADDADHAWFCTATLVTSSQIITARHCIEPYGASATYMVRFRRREDGGLGSVAEGVSSFFHARVSSWSYIGIGNEDVAIGELEAPVYHITPIPLWVTAAAAGSIVQAGWGRTGPGIGSGPATELLLCNNVIAGELLSGIWIKYPSPDMPEYGWNPCGVNTWDSGGPSLALDACGNPWLVALHLSPVGGVRITESMVADAPPEVFTKCALPFTSSSLRSQPRLGRRGR